MGRLLGVTEPLKLIATRLNRDPLELERILNDTVQRRNDIVHRADRSQKKVDDKAQDITYAWALQSIDTIRHVCLALDELIAERIQEFEAAIQPQDDVEEVLS